MSRVPLKSIETSCASGAEVLSGIKKRLGMLPNFFGGLANHLGSLNGYLAFNEAMERESALSKQQREKIALAIANANGCHYCVSGHTLAAKAAGLDAEAARLAQKGVAETPYDQAILKLALEVLETRGHISEETLAMAVDQGLLEAEIVEVVGWVGLNTFSNWINNVIQPKIDFPVVPIQD